MISSKDGNKTIFAALVVILVMLTVVMFTVVEPVKKDKRLAANSNNGQIQAADTLKSWNIDGKTYQELTSYVEKVTKVGSKSYIPPKDRIAVFDMDGTLVSETAPYCLEWMMFLYHVLEDPTFTAPKRMYDFVAEIGAPAVYEGKLTNEIYARLSAYQEQVYEGMTLQEYRDLVLRFLQQPVEGFKNMTYEDSFYKPMKEVVYYLNENDFTVYVVTGADREFCRTAVHKVLGISENHVIGTDSEWNGFKQGNEDGQYYTMETDEDIVRGSGMIKNYKMNKVSAIVREIGKKPVLAFGNSTGDTSMAVYVTSNNPYPSNAFMLKSDDMVRDYGKQLGATMMEIVTEEYGWTAISMKKDFKTIYGDGVECLGKMPAFRIKEQEKPAA